MTNSPLIKNSTPSLLPHLVCVWGHSKGLSWPACHLCSLLEDDKNLGGITGWVGEKGDSLTQE